MEKTYAEHFKDKLKSYSALAGTLIAATSAATAQTVYTDIIPDSTVNTDGGTYQLDLNNDGTFDFSFDVTINPGGTSSSAPPSYNKVGVTPMSSNAVAGSTAGAYVYPLALNTGDTVKSTLTWNVGTNQSMGSYWGGVAPYGNWLGAIDKFIGLKIIVGANTYYGWARLDVDSVGNAFTIKDYAYMNSDGQQIIIGATTVGITENPLAETSIYSDGHHVMIGTKAAIQGTVSVSNTLGQEIYSGEMTGTNKIVDLDGARTGVYFVTVRSQNIKYTKKIIIN